MALLELSEKIRKVPITMLVNDRFTEGLTGRLVEGDSPLGVTAK